MIRRLIAWLNGPDPLTVARSEYYDAWHADNDAVLRGDRRRQHLTSRQLQTATHNLMAAERRG